MQHSYEGLDRVGGFDRVRLFAPLAVRDYRLLVGGMSVSLLGDGLFLVALAWQMYALSNAPTALASAGNAMTTPPLVCLLIGGAVSDRHDRRLVMLWAPTPRARWRWRRWRCCRWRIASPVGADGGRGGLRSGHGVLRSRVGRARP
jgi:hypothetical protein